jgi:hypothetical protein
MKQQSSISTHKDYLALKAKHERALWQVEQLWSKMPEKNYHVRQNLVGAALGLVKIGKEIDRIAQLKVK